MAGRPANGARLAVRFGPIRKQSILTIAESRTSRATSAIEGRGGPGTATHVPPPEQTIRLDARRKAGVLLGQRGITWTYVGCACRRYFSPCQARALRANRPASCAEFHVLSYAIMWPNTAHPPPNNGPAARARATPRSRRPGAAWDRTRRRPRRPRPGRQRGRLRSVPMAGE
jgi:hypothetical protein